MYNYDKVLKQTLCTIYTTDTARDNTIITQITPKSTLTSTPEKRHYSHPTLPGV